MTAGQSILTKDLKTQFPLTPRSVVAERGIVEAGRGVEIESEGRGTETFSSPNFSHLLLLIYTEHFGKPAESRLPRYSLNLRNLLLLI